MPGPGRRGCGCWRQRSRDPDGRRRVKTSLLKKATSRVRGYSANLFGQAFDRPRIGRAGMLAAAALVVAFLLVGLFYVWMRMQLVQIGYEITDMEKRNNVLKNRQRELMVEITSLQNPAELEKQAREKAGLISPEVGKVVHVP